MITIILGRAAQFILALAMLRVATTLLSPEEMGKVSLVLTTVAFFAMFMVNPVGMFINRRIHAWYASGVASGYLKQYAGYLFIVAVLAAFSLPLLDDSGIVNFGMPVRWVVGLVCTSLIFNTINQTSIPLLNMLGDIRSFVWLSVASLAASFLFAVFLIKMVETTAPYWVLGLLLGQALIAVVGTKRLFVMIGIDRSHRTSFNLGRPHIVVLFNFGWPVALAAGLAWVQLQGYRYIVESEVGMAQLGVFVAGYSISAGLIAGFESILTSYFLPRLYRGSNEGETKDQARAWQKYASAVIPSLLLTMVVIMLLATEITRVLLGEQFQGAAKFVLWGALAEGARVLSGVYSLIAHVYMRTQWLIIPTLTGALLSISMTFALIPTLGAEGAGVALAISGITSVALLHVLLAPRVGGSMHIKEIVHVVLAVIVLAITTFAVRAVFKTDGWISILSIFALTGLIYLYLLYRQVRQHL